MISLSYANILNLPIFGFGAKTSNFSPRASALFPLSRSIRNPFTPNDPSTLDQVYSDCLSALKLDVPVHLNPFLEFFKQLGTHNLSRLNRKAQHTPAIKGTVDSFYVLYVLCSGLFDDVQAMLNNIKSADWARLPL